MKNECRGPIKYCHSFWGRFETSLVEQRICKVEPLVSSAARKILHFQKFEHIVTKSDSKSS